INKENDIGEFYLQELSGSCSDSYSVNDSGDESDVIIRKRRGAMQLVYSDSEDDDSNDVEVNDDTRTTNDEPRILEPFEDSPAIKIMPSSSESIIDCANLFIGNDFFEYLVRQSNRYHYQVVNKYEIISKTGKWTDITVPEMKTFLGLFKAYTVLNGKKIRYKNFLHKAALSWIEDCESKENEEDLFNTANNMKSIETRYQGFSDESMMGDYDWFLVRETDINAGKRHRKNLNCFLKIK
ncbi:hypothetical protein WN55_09458, partial [Dufourea novaeangliae]